MLKKSVLLASLLLGAALLPYGCKKSQATAKSETRSTTKTEAASSASVDPQKQMVISLVEKRLNSDTELVKCTDIVNQTAVATNRYTAKAIVFKTKMYEPFETIKVYAAVNYEFIGDSVVLERGELKELEMTDKDQAYVIQLQAEARRIAIAMAYMPVYQSESLLYIGRSQDSSDTTDEYRIASRDLRLGMVVDYQALIQSKHVRDAVIKKIKETYPDFNEWYQIHASVIPNTRFLAVKVDCCNPKYAQVIAKTLSDVFIQEVQKLMELDNCQIINEPVEPTAPIGVQLKRKPSGEGSQLE